MRDYSVVLFSVTDRVDAEVPLETGHAGHRDHHLKF